VKIFCGIAVVCIMTYVDLDPNALPEEKVKCLIDATHTITKPITDGLKSSPATLTALTSTFALAQDALMVV
jgi:hypothetical protein